MPHQKGGFQIVTHNGGFHTDDAVAVSLMELWCEQSGFVSSIVRTRDVDIMQSADCVIDVGGVYDPETHKYDHHQIDFNLLRANNVPYASAGLVWNSIGLKLCNQNIDCFNRIDTLLLAPVDAIDNGKAVVKNTTYDSVYPFDIHTVTAMCYPMENNRTDRGYDDAFRKLVDIVKIIIAETIKTITDEIQSERLVYLAYESATDKRIIELDMERKHIPVLCQYSEPLVVVYQKSDKNWSVKCVRTHGTRDFEYRMLCPQSWRGLRDTELATVSGVPEAVFCHSAGFLFVCTSYESAIKAARMIVS